VKDIPFHRLFSMSTFEGLRLIRRQLNANPRLNIDEVLQIVLRLEPNATSLDIEASVHLHSIIDKHIPHDGIEFYRSCIAKLITVSFPTWAKLITLGRSRFIQKLYAEEFRDVRSLFRQARLLENPPSQLDILWWDQVSIKIRHEGDRLKLEQGRMAEELSLEYEKNRLKAAGIDAEPKWMAIEDNTVGYDILSYDHGPITLKNKLIEVKSTISSSLRFYITRNEWQHALEVGDAYSFHIWNLQSITPVLYIKLASDIAPHIPNNNENGKWTVAEIPVGTP
jgi:hypothetical protein